MMSTHVKLFINRRGDLVVSEGIVSQRVTCVTASTHVKLFINRRGAVSYRREMYLRE